MNAITVLGGSAILCGGIWLLWSAWRERRRVDAAGRLVYRAEAALDELERLDHARRELRNRRGVTREGIAGVSEVVRRSRDIITGIPFAILEGLGRSGNDDEPGED